jgi:hypothetical protein
VSGAVGGVVAAWVLRRDRSAPAASATSTAHAVKV